MSKETDMASKKQERDLVSNQVDPEEVVTPLEEVAVDEGVVDVTPEVDGEAQVVFTGAASSRTITSSDWDSVGAGGQEESVWNLQNDKRIPASKFNAAALRYLTQVDSGFRVE